MNKNNGLLIRDVGFTGWDTTPIQNNNDGSLLENETTNSSNSDAYMKPFDFDFESQPRTHSINGVNQVLDMLFDLNSTTTSTNTKESHSHLQDNTNQTTNDNVKLSPPRAPTKQSTRISVRNNPKPKGNPRIKKAKDQKPKDLYAEKEKDNTATNTFYFGTRSFARACVGCLYKQMRSGRIWITMVFMFTTAFHVSRKGIIKTISI
eukprot:91144_1